MLRRIREAMKALRRYERALAKVTPLIDGRETRKVARAVGYAPEVPGMLAMGEVPFDAIGHHKCTVRLSARQPVQLDLPIAECGDVAVRSWTGRRSYVLGMDVAVSRDQSTIKALRPALDQREVVVEYTAVLPGGRDTYFDRVMEWARGR